MGNEIQVEQVVVLADLPAVEGQGIAGPLRQAIATAFVGEVQIQVIQGRIGQLQQPVALGRGIAGAVIEVDLQPERRTRITGVEGVFIVGLEVFGQWPRADIGNGRFTTRVFKDLHHSA